MHVPPPELLFGLLAVHRGFIDRVSFARALECSRAPDGKSLAEALVDCGLLTPEQRDHVRQLVDSQLAEHGGDLASTLATLAAAGQLDESLAAVSATATSAAAHQGDAVRSLATFSPVSAPRLGDESDRLSTVVGAVPVSDTETLLAPRSSETPADDRLYLTTPGPLPASGTVPIRTADERSSDATRRAGRYSILRPHARGGLGEVSVALDEELHREVALKEIQDRHASIASHRRRFVIEAEITGRLEHPGIVPVYGLGKHADGRPYYAMRFIRGKSLRETIDQPVPVAGLSPREEHEARRAKLRSLLGSFVDVCQAMQFAHDRGIIHRDLKPANIMLGEYGETLVVDWGLAKSLGTAGADASGGGSSRSGPTGASGSTGPLNTPTNGGTTGGDTTGGDTVAGSAIGTPAYMSPEQSLGDTAEIGPASDIYSLGATLYHILTGKPPFKGDVAKVLDSVRKGAFAAPREANPAVPGPLDAVCRKAMAKDPAERYRSCRDLAADVERWLADEPVSACAEPWPERAARWMRKRKGLVAGIAIAAIAFVVAAIIVATAAVWSEQRVRQSYSAELAERSRREKAQLQARDALTTIDDWLSSVDNLLEDQPNHRMLRKWLLDSAIRDLEKLVAQYKDDPTTRGELARAYGRLGAIHWRLQDYARSQECEQARHRILEELDKTQPSPSVALDLARSEAHLALIASARRDGDGATEFFDRAWNRVLPLETQSPREEKTLHELRGAILVHRAEQVHPEDARAPEIAASLDIAERDYDALLKSDPDNLRARLGGVLVAEMRSRFQAEAGDWPDAKRMLATAIARCDDLLKRLPDHPTAREYLAQLRVDEAHVADAMATPEEGMHHLARAAELYAKLAADFPGSTVYAGSELVVTLDELQLRGQLHEHRANLQRWPDVVSRLRERVALNDGDQFLNLLLVRALRQQALDARAVGEFATARAALGEAQAVLDRIDPGGAVTPDAGRNGNEASDPEVLEERILWDIVRAELESTESVGAGADALFAAAEARLARHARLSRPVRHADLTMTLELRRGEHFSRSGRAALADAEMARAAERVSVETPHPRRGLYRLRARLWLGSAAKSEHVADFQFARRLSEVAPDSRLLDAWMVSAALAAGDTRTAAEIARGFPAPAARLVEEHLAAAELARTIGAEDAAQLLEAARRDRASRAPHDESLRRWESRAEGGAVGK
jgi:serine/threonine protein kinase/tetratricopeptide (TPR) repeat protein